MYFLLIDFGTDLTTSFEDIEIVYFLSSFFFRLFKNCLRQNNLYVVLLISSIKYIDLRKKQLNFKHSN